MTALETSVTRVKEGVQIGGNAAWGGGQLSGNPTYLDPHVGGVQIGGNFTPSGGSICVGRNTHGSESGSRSGLPIGL